MNTLRKSQRQFLRQFPKELSLVDASEYPQTAHSPVLVFRSRKYLVQIFEEYTTEYPELKRMSVCRSRLGSSGRWEDGITWDELQVIKSEIGYGDWYGMEIYPPDKHVVNVANMRHLWIMPTPLSIGWFKSSQHASPQAGEGGK